MSSAGKRASAEFSESSTKKSSQDSQSLVPVDPDKYAKKFHFVTQMMLRKSEYLLSQVNDVRMTDSKKMKKLTGKKKMKKTANSSMLENSGDVVGDNNASMYRTENVTLPRIGSAKQEHVIKSHEQLPRIGENETEAIEGFNDLNISAICSDDNNKSFEIVVERSPEKIRTVEVSIASTSDQQPVETSTSRSSSPAKQLKLSQEWLANRVNGGLDDMPNAMTKVEWENQLARHILSVFATANSGKNFGNSESLDSNTILDYVDPNRSESLSSVVEFVGKSHETLASEGHEKRNARIAHNQSSFDGTDGAINDTSMANPSRVGSPSKNKTSKSVTFKTDELRNSTESLKANKTKQKPKLLGISTSEDMNAVTSTKTDEDPDASFYKSSKFRTCVVVQNKEGKLVSLRGSPHVTPIWFVSSGDIYSNWSSLLQPPHGERLQAQLSVMYEHKHYKEYLGSVHRIITDVWRERFYGETDVDAIIKGTYMSKDKSGPSNRMKDDNNSNNNNNNNSKFKQSLLSATNIYATHLQSTDLEFYWKQLILTANAMGVLAIENGQVDMCLEILTKAEEWSNRDDVIEPHMRDELKAYVNDTLAFYFYKRERYSAAQSYASKANKLYDKCGNVEGVGTSLLHIAAAQSLAGKFVEAHKTLHLFLAMLDEGRMAWETATPKQLCQIAVGYNNLAVVELKLLAPDMACKSSQNARKIAKLCLSYSNRWLDTFQWVHRVAIEDVKFHLTTKTDLEGKHLDIMKGLVEAMFDPSPPV